MKKDRNKLIITSALTSSLGVFISKLLGIVYVVPITRIIGETDLVFYTYAYRIYDFFLTLSIAGLPFAISLVVSRYYTLEDYRAVISVKKVAQYLMIFLGVLSFAILLFFAGPIAKIMNVAADGEYLRHVKNVLFIVSFALLIIPTLSSLRGFQQGTKEFAIPAISMVIEQVARVVFMLVSAYIIIVVLEKEAILAVYWVVGSAVFAGFCSLLYMLIAEKKRNKELIKKAESQASGKLDWKVVLKELVINGLPFVLSFLLADANNQINLLFFNRAMYSRGHPQDYIKLVDSILHFSALKLQAIPQVLAVGFGIAIIPILTSSLVKKDYSLLRKQANDVLNSCSYIALPIVFCLAYFNKAFYSVLYGYQNYLIGAEILVWTCINGIANSIFPMLSNIAMATRLRRKHMLVLVAGLLVKLATTYPLIYVLGYPGAIISSFLSTATVFLLNMYIISRTHKINFKAYFFNVFKMVLALGSMFVVAKLAQLLGLNFHYQGQLRDLLILAEYGVLTCGTYLVCSYFLKLPQTIFGFNVQTIKNFLKKDKGNRATPE